MHFRFKPTSITGLAGDGRRFCKGLRKTKTTSNQREEALLSVLIDTARRVGLTVLEENLLEGETPVASGVCRYRDEWFVLLDPACGARERITILARALRQVDLEAVYVPPAVRDLLHRGSDGDDGDEKT